MMTRATIALTAIVCGGAALAFAQPAVREYLGLVGVAPAWLCATYPVTAAATRTIPIAALRSTHPLLIFFFVHAVATAGALGAASAADFGAGWTLLLVLPASWGALFPDHRGLLAAMLIVPPLERAALGAGPSAASIGYAAAMGLATAASFVVCSRRALWLRARNEAALAHQGLGANAAAAAGARLAAMRLHDGLSGALVLAHARAARGDDREALEAARTFARHGRRVLDERDAASTDLRGWLAELVQHLGIEVEIELAATEVSADVRELLVELLANQARHGAAAPVRLALSSDRDRVRIELAAPRVARPHRDGRGTRNLERRIAARGGAREIVDDADQRRTVIAIPHVWQPFRGEPIVHAMVPLVAWGSGAGVWFVVSTCAYAGMSILLAVQQNRRVAAELHTRRNDARARSDHASRPALGHARAELAPRIDRLERAADEGRADAVRATFDELRSRLSALLLELETAADEPLSRGDRDVAPPARLAADS